MKPVTLLFAAAAIVVPIQAQSQNAPWADRAFGFATDPRPRYGPVYCESDGRCYRDVTYNGYTYVKRHHRKGTRVYGYTRYSNESASCRETRRVVGDQHLTVEGAKKAANDAWSGTIRFHLGEKYMDLGNARHITYTCSRSSIKEGSVATLGQTLTRCEIEAQPCAAPRASDEK